MTDFKSSEPAAAAFRPQFCQHAVLVHCNNSCRAESNLFRTCIVLCRRGLGCRKVLWQLSLSLHEWHAASRACVLLVQGMLLPAHLARILANMHAYSAIEAKRQWCCCQIRHTEADKSITQVLAHQHSAVVTSHDHTYYKANPWQACDTALQHESTVQC